MKERSKRALSRRLIVGGLAVSALDMMLAPSPASARLLETLRIGIFPYTPALKIEQLYSPVAVALERLLNCNVLLRTRGSFEAFRDALLDDQFDVALMHPFLFVDMERRRGMRPLVRVDHELQAVVLAQADYSSYGFPSLRKKTLALPPRLSGVSHLALLELAEAGLTCGVNVTVRHFQWKTSCIHAVAVGEADGCAVPTFWLKQSRLVDQMRFKIVARTRAVTGLLLATRSGLPQPVSDAMTTEMLGWSSTKPGRMILDTLGWPGLREATDRDYDLVRSLGSDQVAEAAG